jgi:large subunit ribosomal protein L32
MPVPKRKRSRSRRDKRHANKGLKYRSLGGCANCNEPVQSHQACTSCGYYKGRKVLATKADRAVKRAETKQSKAAHQKTAPVDAIDAESSDK